MHHKIFKIIKLNYKPLFVFNVCNPGLLNIGFDIAYRANRIIQAAYIKLSRRKPAHNFYSIIS
jgi:hypothetical protein